MGLVLRECCRAIRLTVIANVHYVDFHNVAWASCPVANSKNVSITARYLFRHGKRDVRSLSSSAKSSLLSTKAPL